MVGMKAFMVLTSVTIGVLLISIYIYVDMYTLFTYVIILIMFLLFGRSRHDLRRIQGCGL